MSLSASIHENGISLRLLPPVVITTAVANIVSPALTTPPQPLLSGMKYLVAQAIVVYGSGGTTIKAWVQTSLDGGETWVDIMSFAFTTASLSKISACNAYIAPAAQAFAPGDAALADNTIIQGVMGDRVRVKYTTTGTYADSTTLAIDAIAKG